MPADPFVILDRLVARYRRDVNQLAPGASAEALQAIEAHLKRPLPEPFHKFLARHNGADLLRGVLRIRSTSEITAASASVPNVVLFADGQGDTRWAYAPTPGEGSRFAFGTWDGERLNPLHASFGGWLAGTLAVLDARVTRTEDQESLRLEADPDDVYQLVAAGSRALAGGRPEEAESFLRKATAADPHHVLAWQRLGDALSAGDRTAARQAWLQAFRSARLPLPWPGAPCLEADILRMLPAAIPDVELYERELVRFLDERVGDAGTQIEVDLVVAVSRELARVRTRRGKRSPARDALTDLLARCRDFKRGSAPWEALLELARIELELGNHNETEALLRRFRRESPADPAARPELAGAAGVLLARVAVTRHEPWAEEILDEALAGPIDDEDRVEAATLHVERAIRHERLDEAKKWLDEARRLAGPLGIRALNAAVAACEADVARLSGDLVAAREAIKRGLVSVTDKDDVELRLRLLIRRGDVAMAGGQAEEAIAAWREATEGFASAELPVREGWALTRLARLARDPEQLLNAAHSRFAAADLAAGVAAVDALRGDPGRSLAWHLDRAEHHARARHDAQRARPPWDRSDADRPERRIGAHRLAIAACTDGVVGSIAAEIDAQTRAIRAGRGRPLDPPVMRYVAAVDLLSAHRSYPAAQVLLKHLLEGSVDGVAARALQGAVARSPNAALVDGLLSCVETPGSFPADAVAAAAEVLGLRREKAAINPLLSLAAEGSNPIARKAAITALGRIGDRGVAEDLLPALDEPSLAEAAGLALLMLGDRRGVDFHAKALAEGKKDLSGSPGEIVGRYGGPAYLLLLVRSAEGTGERALGAVQGLGLMGDSRGVPALLQAVAQQRDRQMVEVAAGALQILTGHHEDIEEQGLKHRWNAWWDSNGPRFKEGVRHRDGKPFSGELLLAKMDHPDPWARRTAYDELVISTGGNLPFDVDGPWRVQRAHLRAWQAWWKKSGARQIPGRWYLDGMPNS